ncbi:MAG TPA: flagellar hook-length control protein FliK [Limnobacter sp.]|uniref:flagellar hook-length control protein FliK n=1 Tax=Limnobacter sp. TaxID=2003368 RepID=UPI002E2F31CE|nr:flagellar hook-length control protein FliK [Limnobacter sp.]HEX5485152.1 flagellar hook-length control protein FliK [Limnobacter sp.]
MSASAQSIQTRNNAAASQAAQATQQSKVSSNSQAEGFGTLFASALSSLTPQAKLSTIQEEMREALNQNSSKKSQNNSDNLALAGQQQASEAAVWAQRSWMNATPAQSASASTSSPPVQSAQSKQPDSSNTQTEKSGSVQTAANKDKPAEGEKVKDSTTAQTDDHTQAKASDNKQDNAPASAKDASTDAASAATQTLQDQAPTQTDVTDTIAQNAVALKADTSAGGSNDADPLNKGKSAPDVDLKGPTTAAPQPLNTHTTQIARNAAVQAMQVAQQAQAMSKTGQGAEADVKGLQAGDKILATGASSAASATGNPAAGLMGLGTTRTGLAGEALIKTPVNQPGFVKELAQQVNWTLGKNMSTVDIRVNPESFGPMNMRLVQKGQEIHLVIRTQDDQSAAMMTQAVHGLKEALAQSGLQLGQVQIHGSAADAQNAFANLQQQAQGQQQANGGKGQRQGGQGQSDGESADMDSAPKAVAPKIGNNGLDLFA